MTVSDLLAFLGDAHVAADDQVFVLGKDRLIIGRGPFVVAVIDMRCGTLTKGVGIRPDADACAAQQGASQ